MKPDDKSKDAETEIDDSEAPGSDIEDDTLLNLLIHLAEKGIGSSITLYTNGLVLTGALASRKGYFEASAQFLKSTGLEVIFEEILADYPEPDPDAPAPNYRYVHLQNAQVVVPGGAMPNEGNLMRIKRSEVSGWSLGQLKIK